MRNRVQIGFSVNIEEFRELELILNGRSAYAFALEAMREKVSREKGANK